MRSITLHLYTVPSGKTRRTLPWRMTAETARKYKGAEVVPGSAEERLVHDDTGHGGLGIARAGGGAPR